MGKIRWYKRDPNAALAGMANLTLEEKGAYNTLLDLIYGHDGAVDDDARYLAGWMRCDVRVWKRIRARLIELGKIYVDNGQLRNRRADEEVDEGLSRVASVSEANRIKGIKSGAVRRKNKGIDEPDHEPKSNTTTATTTEDKKEAAASSLARENATGISEQAWQLAGQLAAICGHPMPPEDWPPDWAGAPMRIQGWLNSGWQPLVILVAARASAGKKPPKSIKRVDYFEGAIADEHARQAKPIPKTEVSSVQTNQPAGARSGPGGGFARYASDLAKSAGS